MRWTSAGEDNSLECTVADWINKAKRRGGGGGGGVCELSLPIVQLIKIGLAFSLSLQLQYLVAYSAFGKEKEMVEEWWQVHPSLKSAEVETRSRSAISTSCCAAVLQIGIRVENCQQSHDKSWSFPESLSLYRSLLPSPSFDPSPFSLRCLLPPFPSPVIPSSLRAAVFLPQSSNMHSRQVLQIGDRN